MGFSFLTLSTLIARQKQRQEEERKRREVEAERQRMAYAAEKARAEARARSLARIALETAKRAAAERKRRELELQLQRERIRRQQEAAAAKARAETKARAEAEARLAAKNEAIAYSQNKTNALRKTIMATIAMEAAAVKKAQEASDVATRLKFERIAEQSRKLALKRNAERTQLLKQIEKNKQETDTQFTSEIAKITRWQDKHTKMPVNFVVNFLPSNV